MQIISPSVLRSSTDTTQPHALQESREQPRSTPGPNAAADARETFIDKADEDIEAGRLSPSGQNLAAALLHQDARTTPGVQVSTLAVDGVQARDIVVVKRVPPVAGEVNILLYIPQASAGSFQEFETLQQMTDWAKHLSTDPASLETFARHFADETYPGQLERVKKNLGAFTEGSRNAVVGSFGYETGDIFERLDKGPNVAPVPVNGLMHLRLYKADATGNVTFMGTRNDGQTVLYKYDAYGNLHGGSRDGFYFVRNGLNNDQPLALMSLNEYRKAVTDVALDNVGANDIRGLYDEFIRQLRNPGQGLGTALNALGVPEDIASSIEKILVNPLSGSLRELNQGNRIGTLFGVEQTQMDEVLASLGSQLPLSNKYYSLMREVLNQVADQLEPWLPKEPDTTVS